MKKLLQSYLASKGLYSGPLDGVLSPELIGSIKSMLSATTEDWDDRRVFYAGLQRMAADEKLYAGEIDGISSPASQYGIEVYASRVTGQPEPPRQVFETPKRKSVSTKKDSEE